MKLLQLTFSTIFASISSLTLIPAASAITWSLLGNFDDGGTISGTFFFDESNETYRNIDLKTTVGSTITVSYTHLTLPTIYSV